MLFNLLSHNDGASQYFCGIVLSESQFPFQPSPETPIL